MKKQKRTRLPKFSPCFVQDLHKKIVSILLQAFKEGKEEVLVMVPLPPYKIPLLGSLKVAENLWYWLSPKKQEGHLVYQINTTPPTEMPELPKKKGGNQSK